MNDLWEKVKAVSLILWSRTTRRMRIAAAFLAFM